MSTGWGEGNLSGKGDQLLKRERRKQEEVLMQEGNMNAGL